MNKDLTNEAAFNESLIDFIAKLLEKSVKDLLEYCLDTKNADGVKKLIEILEEYRYK